MLGYSNNTVKCIAETVRNSSTHELMSVFLIGHDSQLLIKRVGFFYNQVLICISVPTVDIKALKKLAFK